MTSLRSLLFLLLIILGAASRATSSDFFHENDRWASVGDSITRNGAWQAWIFAYYATRFPGLALEPVNVGISGDTVSGTITRYGWDIQPRHTTVATIMFGANDITRDLYKSSEPSTETLERRKAAIMRYQDNVRKLIGMLEADGTRIILMTPTLYDETANLPKPDEYHGVNAALGECAQFIHDFGAEHRLPVIDLYGPMNALNLDIQKRDPSLTLTGPDRLHPARPGTLVMAYFFLKAQGVPAIVSRTSLDAASVKVLQTENTDIENLTGGIEGITFTQKEAALPCPVDKYSAQALEWIPFHQDLNQEILQVTGLRKGSYELIIDQTPITQYSAEELANGVNLALQPATPQSRQAADVLSLIKEWRDRVDIDRTIAQTEHGLMRNVARPISFETAKPIVEKALEGLKVPGAYKPEYTANLYNSYLKEKPAEQENRALLEKYPARIREAAAPKSHHYQIIQVIP